MLKMNIFSQTARMTAHHYLEGVRMANAKDRLLDPHRRGL
jgi:hypothetical protein